LSIKLVTTLSPKGIKSENKIAGKMKTTFEKVKGVILESHNKNEGRKRASGGGGGEVRGGGRMLWRERKEPVGTEGVDGGVVKGEGGMLKPPLLSREGITKKEGGERRRDPGRTRGLGSQLPTQVGRGGGEFQKSDDLSVFPAKSHGQRPPPVEVGQRSNPSSKCLIWTGEGTEKERKFWY